MLNTPLFLLPNNLKYEVCCIEDDSQEDKICKQEAVCEITAVLKDKSIIYIPVCDQKEHQIKAKALGESFQNAKIPAKSSLKEWLFIQPVGESNKGRLDLWLNFKNQVSEPEPEKPKVEIKPICKTTDSWQWIEDIDRWMDIAGNIIPIAQLSNDELIFTIQAIVRANYKSSGGKVIWVNKLIRPKTTSYEFTNNVLVVGKCLAREKLEEFQNECISRGLI
jgi:hypothetical protein